MGLFGTPWTVRNQRGLCICFSWGWGQMSLLTLSVPIHPVRPNSPHLYMLVSLLVGWSICWSACWSVPVYSYLIKVDRISVTALWADGRIDSRQTDGWMNGWVDGWANRGIERQTDRGTQGCRTKGLPLFNKKRQKSLKSILCVSMNCLFNYNCILILILFSNLARMLVGFGYPTE